MNEVIKQTLLPEEIRVQIGNLTIESKPHKGGSRSRVTLPQSVRICINGAPVSVRRLVLTVDMNDVVKAQVEFMPAPPAEADPGVIADRLGAHDGP